jgi:hypothetical protein
VGLIAAEEYPGGAERQQFYERVLRALRRLPGVEAAAITTRLRMTLGGAGPYEVEGVTYADTRDRPRGSFENITGGYFAALGLAVSEGRDFNESDADARQPVALVSAAFAAKHFGGASALGRKVRPFTPAQPGPWRTIVGVVPDVVMQSPPFSAQLGTVGLYLPLAANPPQFATLVVRPHSGAPELAKRALRGAVAEVDPNLPLYFVESPQQSHAVLLAQNQILAQLFAAFGAIAVLLAVGGVYGVMAFGVGQRTQEFGVRLALGASRRQLLLLLAGEVGRDLGLGLGLGLLGAFVLVQGFVHVYADVLFGVRPFAPGTYGVIAILVIAVVGLAALVPAFRATQVDPARALRAG